MLEKSTCEGDIDPIELNLHISQQIVSLHKAAEVEVGKIQIFLPGRKNVYAW